MNSILSEKEYQKFILERLEQDNGYIIRDSKKYDRYYAVDRELVFKFLNNTQPDKMQILEKIYKGDLEETVINYVNQEITKTRGSLLDVLKHGVDISNQHLELMYTKPATTFNKELLALYDMNIFSVMEEVWCSDKERVDIVIFLNGFAVISFELKCNMAGQSYQDAIYQYRTDRDPKNRLFLFNAGCLVNFAMDLNEVYMCTKLSGQSSFFLPFNKGNGEGVRAGAGNPVYEDRYSVYYMWEDILKKDTLIEIISKFMFLETKDEEDELTGKIKHKETLIFPRYHQLDVIRKVLEDIRQNLTAQNYLIQHSTLLSNSVTPNAVYDLEAKVDSYALIDPVDVDNTIQILYEDKATAKQKQRITYYLQKSKKMLDNYDYTQQKEAVTSMRRFVRYYEFLLQVSSFEDAELHKKYRYIAYLLAFINIKHPGMGFDLDGKIKAYDFAQKKGKEHKGEKVVSSPVVKLPTAEQFGLTEDKEKRLSEIIDEINSRTGKTYDSDVAIKAMLQIRDILLKSDKLRASAKNNTEKDFEFAYFDDIDNALIEGLEQNQDFFSLLLSNDDLKREVLGIFTDEIYKSLKKE